MVVYIHAAWDPVASVFVATSSDIKGLVTEADTMPHLIDKLHDIVPWMLEEQAISNGTADDKWRLFDIDEKPLS